MSKPIFKIDSLAEPTDADLAEMGITRESYKAQVNAQMKQIGAVLEGFFNIRKALKQDEPTDAEIDSLLELFSTIKYHSILFQQFMDGEIMFNVDLTGKIQVVTLVNSDLPTDIPPDRTLN